MREDFIAYLWKHQYFQKNGLYTSKGLTLQILKAGEENTNAGPDFFNAQVIIDGQKWAGNVELHVKSSDWYVHGHETDTNYDNVILHVVWEDDAPVFRKNQSSIATLELSKYIDRTLLNNYRKLFSRKQKWVNCENEINVVDRFLLNAWLERLYFERLDDKTRLISELLRQSNNDWEAVLFQLLTRNFGLKVNGGAFFELAKNLDFSVIRKEANDLNQLEALFFGQVGLLHEEIEDSYFNLLKGIYNYQLKKYKLKPTNILSVEFFRLRPYNFPTIRLAQLACLYHHYQNLFSKIIETKNLATFYELFDVAASSFWDTHYTFEAASNKGTKRLTNSFIDLLLINTIIPIKFIYQKSLGKSNEEEILNLIEAIKSEKNAVIDKFAQLGIQSNSAITSQSLVQLKNEYCKKQRCLHCQIGTNILRN